MMSSRHRRIRRKGVKQRDGYKAVPPSVRDVGRP